MTTETFAKGMALVLKTFNIQPDPQTLAAWEMLLHDIDDQDFIFATIQLCRTKDKAPWNMAAAIRNEITERNFSSEEAWGEVVREISRTGSYGTPRFSDIRIEKAVQTIGWKEICATENKNMGTLRAHFYRTHEAMGKRECFEDTTKLIDRSAELKQLVASIGRRIPQGTS